MTSLGYASGKGSGGRYRLARVTASPAAQAASSNTFANGAPAQAEAARNSVVARCEMTTRTAPPPCRPILARLARAKLAEPLRDLAARVERDGADGTLAIGNLKIANYRVDVMIFLKDLSEPTLAALKELGFEQTSDAKAVKLLVGAIDVRKLEDLAKLDAVVRIQPVVAP